MTLGHLIVSLLSATLLLSCSDRKSDRVSSEEFLSRVDFSSRQDAREEVEMLSYENPAIARSQLEKAWQSASSSQSTWSGDPVVRVAIAGQLMRLGEGSKYDEYYSYVESQASSSDVEVATVALGALSLARGTRSLEVLFRYAKNSSGSLAFSALEAIDFRMITSRADPSLSSEKAYLEEATTSLCGSRELGSEVRRFCQKQKMKPRITKPGTPTI